MQRHFFGLPRVRTTDASPCLCNATELLSPDTTLWNVNFVLPVIGNLGGGGPPPISYFYMIA
jgi:hypothetical protein